MNGIIAGIIADNSRQDKWVNHPELRPGEIFVTNAILRDYHLVGWSTKRAGNIAYDLSGEVAEGCFPVFVQIAEIEAEES